MTSKCFLHAALETFILIYSLKHILSCVAAMVPGAGNSTEQCI